MSKGNMLLGHARGKVGDLVFARSNGQQIVRAKAAVVKNPQTEAQMMQRILMLTTIRAYSSMAAIVDHSFEGRQPGQPSMSAWIAANIKALRSRVAQAIANPVIGLDGVRSFVPLGMQFVAANPYTMSSGSLPAVSYSLPTATTAMLAGDAQTYASLIAALGLQRGDQLTFVALVGNTSEAATFHYSRIILDPQNADGSQAELDSPLVADGAVNLPSPRNTGTFGTLTATADGLTFNPAAASSTIRMAAVIVSRKSSSGSWLRSTQLMAVNSNVVAEEYSMREALDLAAAGGIGTLSDLYLNNAGQGAVAMPGSSSAGISVDVTVNIVDAEGQSSTANGTVIAVQRIESQGVSYVGLTLSDGSKAYVKNNIGTSTYYNNFLKAGASDAASAWQGTLGIYDYKFVSVGHADALYAIINEATGYTDTTWDYQESIRP